MKRGIHQRRNLRERRPGLEKWKRYSGFHYMMVWVVHMKVLEVHMKVLEVHRMVLEVYKMVLVGSDACKIVLVLEA